MVRRSALAAASAALAAFILVATARKKRLSTRREMPAPEKRPAIDEEDNIVVAESKLCALLSDDDLEHIYRFLDASSLISMSSVDSRMREMYLSMGPKLWRALTLKQFPSAGDERGALERSNVNWKARYYLLQRFSKPFEFKYQPAPTGGGGRRLRGTPKEILKSMYSFFIEVSTADCYSGDTHEALSSYKVFRCFDPINVFDDGRNMVRFSFIESADNPGGMWIDHGNAFQSLQLYVMTRQGTTCTSFAHLMEISFQASLPQREDIDDSAGPVTEVLGMATPQWSGAWAVPCLIAVVREPHNNCTVISFEDPTVDNGAFFASMPHFVSVRRLLSILENREMLHWVHSVVGE